MQSRRDRRADSLVFHEDYDAFDSGTMDWIVKLVDFVKAVQQKHARVRTMAVCFGHQIVGRANGVLPERNDLWEVSVQPIVLTKTGRQVFGQDSLVRGEAILDRSIGSVLISCRPYIKCIATLSRDIHHLLSHSVTRVSAKLKASMSGIVSSACKATQSTTQRSRSISCNGGVDQNWTSKRTQTE